LKRVNYTVGELFNDESFRRWVEGRASSQEEKRWDQWINSTESNRKLANEAAQSIVGFTFQRPEMPSADKEWIRVRERINSHHRGSLLMNKRLGVRYSWIYAAAVVLLSVIAGVAYYAGFWNTNQAPKQIAEAQEKTITTGDSEQKTITLSDGSKIVLKSNASLTYYDGWVSGKTVRIRLNGEAYFSIAHRKTSARPELRISTPQGTILDMGTRFEVISGVNRTIVVLEDGSVSVEPRVGRISNKIQRITVTPGELVELKNEGTIIKRKVNPTLYTSWATGILKFDYTTVSNFAQRLEKMYNIKVMINPDLTTKKLNGAVYYRSMQDLVKAVSQVLKAPVYSSATGDTIYIGQQTNTTLNN